MTPAPEIAADHLIATTRIDSVTDPVTESVDNAEAVQAAEIVPRRVSAVRKAEKTSDRNGRKTISEVLHDIYDSNA